MSVILPRCIRRPRCSGISPRVVRHAGPDCDWQCGVMAHAAGRAQSARGHRHFDAGDYIDGRSDASRRSVFSSDSEFRRREESQQRCRVLQTFGTEYEGGATPSLSPRAARDLRWRPPALPGTRRVRSPVWRRSRPGAPGALV